MDLHRFARRCKELCAFAARRTREAQLKQVASSLTLTMVTSIVPVLAVVLALFSSIPSFAKYREQLEQVVLGSFLPEQYSEQLVGYMHTFTQKAAGLTTFGVIGLVVVALLLIATIDAAINQTFRVQKMRGLGARFLIYWAFLTLGPLVLIGSLAITSYAATSSILGWDNDLARWGLYALQIAIYGVAFTMIYALVPNCHVFWKDAAVGGFGVAVSSQILKAGFSYYVTHGTWGTIYGAFAVVPVFLVWMYATWLLILFGAAVVASLPVLRSGRYADDGRVGRDFLAGATMLRELMIAGRKSANNGILTVGKLSRASGMDPSVCVQVLRKLEKCDYVAELAGGKNGSWALVTDPSKMTLVPAFSALAVDPDNEAVEEGGPLAGWMRKGLAAEWIAAPMAVSLMEKPED